LAEGEAPVKFEIEWKAFFLNRNIPPEGMPWAQYFQENYGGNYDLTKSLQHLSDMGAKAGIDFKGGIFKQDQPLFPTLNSHRAAQWAKETHGNKSPKVDALMESMFSMYFEKAGTLDSVDGIAGCATGVGLDGGALKAYLDDETQGKDTVLYEAKMSQQSISGVPYFMLRAGRSKESPYQDVHLNGGQPPAVFLRAFQKLLSRLPK
jgi:predicted DsbA family dithiol-disulfide isomerase